MSDAAPSPPSELAALFAAEGEPLTVSGNTPFLLDDPAAVWRVESGVVEVFSVGVQEGRVTSSRHHYFTVPAGGLLLGMDMTMAMGRSFLAVGMVNTQLRRLPRERLHRCAAAALGPALEQWVTGLATGVSKDINPRTDFAAEPGRTYELTGSQSLRAKEGVVWLRVQSGALLFIGMEELNLAGQPALFPLAADARLEALGNAKVAALDTAAALGGPADGVWSGLAALYQSVLSCEFLNRPLAEADEFNRIKAKAGWDKQAEERAARLLGSVLAETVAPAPEAANDLPIFGVCERIGARQGFEVRLPAELVRNKAHKAPLQAIARASRVRTREVALRGFWWRESNGPLLAYLEKDHVPVALLPAAKGYVLEHPGRPQPVRVDAAVAATLEPMAVMFYRPFPPRSLRPAELLAFGGQGSGAELWRMGLIALAIGLLGLVTPWATGVIFDAIIPEAERSQLAQMIIGLLLVGFGGGAFQFCRNLIVLRMEGRMDGRLQAALFDRVLELPVDFFRDYSAGDLADRTATISAIRQILSNGVMTSALGALFSLLSLVLLFKYHVKLAFVSCGLAVLAGLITYLLGAARVRHQRRVARLQGSSTSLVLQLLTGVSKLRNAAAEVHAFAAWARRFSDQKREAYLARGYESIVNVFTAAYPTICSAVIFFMLFYFAQAGGDVLPTGLFLAFNAAFGTFIAGVLGLSDAAVQMFNIQPLLERIQPILAAAPEVSEGKLEAPELAGRIELTQVSYRYFEKDPLVLRNISLSIRAGEFVAFVGPSGSGKSTLLRLLLGFGQPETGAIHYDGHDLATLDIGSVRRQIGVVLQNGKLLPGDIYTNITGALPLTEQEAWDAAALAGLGEDIEKMPMGLHTVISSGGGTLSGGQQQRLMIARAIANRPRLLFFDEATSALDNRTQALVTKSLDALQATRVVIAHRLSTIMNADRIFVVSAGELVQEGNYETLINQPGVFGELAKRQLVDMPD